MLYFQTFPDLVSSKIFEYILFNISESFSNLEPGNIKPFCPLLWSCRDWRYMVLCSLFKKQTLNIYGGRLKHTTPSWPDNLDIPVASVSHMAKSLRVHIEYPLAEPFEEYFENMDPFHPPESMVFSKAQLITVVMLSDARNKKNYRENKYVYNNNSLLIQYLQLAVPNVCDLDILSMLPPHHTLGRSFMEPFTEFLKKLVVSVPKRKLAILQYGASGPLDLGSIDSTRYLTYIHVKELKALQDLELIRRCARTLKVLELDKSWSTDNINNIFKDGNNNYVVYPNMRQLLCGLNEDEDADVLLPTFPGTTLLPCLQRFSCPCVYPFGDDAVFRGNQQTLQCLDLKMGPKTVEILIRNNVFASTSHPNLKRVAIRIDYVKFGNYNGKYYANLVHEIGKNALELKLDILCYQYLQPLHFSQLQLLGQHGLQKLSFKNYPLSIDEIITIVKSLSNLVELSTSISTTETPTTAQNFQQLIYKQYPLETQLQTLVVFSNFGYMAKEDAWALLTITILCPKIWKLGLPYDQKLRNLSDDLRVFLDKELYNGHVARIEMLKILFY